MSDSTQELKPDSTTDQANVILSEGKGLSADDQKEINDEIERAVAETRLGITEDTFKFRANKRGAFFVVAINLIAVIAVAGVYFFLSPWLTSRKQADINNEVQTFASTEGRLLERQKREAEAKLAAKDQEIAKIQTELEQIDAETQALRDGLEEELTSREALLRAQIEAELQSERARLAELGDTQEEIDKKLADLETQRQQELTNQLSTFRASAEADLQAKEEELQKNKALTEEILQKASEERSGLLQESQEREAELVARFEAQREELEERTTEVLEQLSELSAVRQRESLMDEQIIGAYSLVNTKFRLEDYTGAEQDLNDLKALFSSPAIDNLPSIAKRRDVELFVIDKLLELAKKETAKETAAPASLIEAADLLVSARGIVAQADQARTVGNSSEAQRLYKDALEEIPTLSNAYRQLQLLDVSSDSAIIAQYISAGTADFEAGNVLDAIGSYRSAVVSAAEGNSQLVNAALQGINESYRMLEEDSLSEKDALIADLRSQLDTARRDRERLANASSRSDQRLSTLEADLADRDATIGSLNSELSASRTEVRRLGGNVSNSSAQVEDLENDITSIEKDLSDSRNEISTLNGEMKDLKDERDVLKKQIDDMEKQAERRIAELSSSTNSEVADLIRKYEADLKALEKQKDDEIDELRDEKDEQIKTLTNTSKDELNAVERAKDQELRGLRRDKDDEISTLTKNYNRNVADLEKQLSSVTKTSDTANQEEIDALNDRVEALDAQIRAKDRQIQRKDNEITQIESLKIEYSETSGRINRLLRGGDAADAATAKKLLDSFLDKRASTIFPAIGTLVDRTVEANQKDEGGVTYTASDLESAKAQATGQGKNEVLGSLVLYINYLEKLNQGSDRKSELAKDAIEESASNDLLYSNLLAKIEDLSLKAAGADQSLAPLAAGAGAISSAGNPLRLVGTVISESGGDVKIDPLIGVNVSRGSSVIIRRRSGDQEREIAKGLVDVVASRRIEAEIIVSYDDDTRPLWGDLAYVEVE